MTIEVASATTELCRGVVVKHADSQHSTKTTLLTAKKLVLYEKEEIKLG